jgi:outer membrane protein TolC
MERDGSTAMKKSIERAVRTTGTAAFFAGAMMLAGPAHAQLGAPAGGTTPAQATQLPLSGKTASQSGTVAATESPLPGTTTSVNEINTTVQVQGSYAGSVNGAAFSGKLSLREAVQRGLQYNLGAVGMTQTVASAHAMDRIAKSALLPNISGYLEETAEQVDLAAVGFRFKIPISGFSIPTVVGPFNYMDIRAQLTQQVANLTDWNNYKAAKQTLDANRLTAQDAKDLIVLAVGGAYLQVLAAQARVTAQKSQIDTAERLYKQAQDNFSFGRAAQLDVTRSQVEELTQQQRMITLQNDVAKQKINLARLIGLPPNDQYDLTDDESFAPAPPITVTDALKQAFDQRADLKAAQAAVQAAESERSAARAERYPYLSVSGNYGDIGINPGNSHGTFTAQATLSVPIWNGGRTSGDIEQADATIAQRRAEVEDLKAQIESDVRTAFLDMQAASDQVNLAQQNLALCKDTLEQTRIKFEAGASSSVEIVQTQETVAGAQLDYISAIFAHNLAKLNLARAIGRTSDNLALFLKMQ